MAFETVERLEAGIAPPLRLARRRAEAADLRSVGRATLRAFRGGFIRAGGVRHPFVTDPRTLTRLGNAGEIAFEDLYVITL